MNSCLKLSLLIRGLRLSFLLAPLLSATHVAYPQSVENNVRLGSPGQSSQSQSAETQDRQEVTTLEPGKRIERELSGGQIHAYQLRLIQGRHTAIDLEQRGIDVGVEVVGPDERLIADFDYEIRHQGREEIEVVAETAGTYTLFVKAKLKNASAGRYEIHFTGVRSATNDDRLLHESRRLYAQFVRLQQVRKSDEARSLVERALAMVQSVSQPSKVYVAQLIMGLGDTYHNKIDDSKAKPFYERSLAILEKELGFEHPLTALVTGRLGMVLFNLEQMVPSDQLLNRALEISEKTLGPEHPQVALCLINVGQLLDKRSDKRAEQLYLRALAIGEKALGKEALFLSAVLIDLGVFHLGERDYDRAEPFLQRSLAIKEKLLGPDHLDLANVLQNLGIIAREKKDYLKAEKYYSRAISIREKAFGMDHQDVAMGLNNMANLYRAQGDYQKSLNMHLRSLSILEKTAGPLQWYTVLALGNIAKNYAAMGDLANALEFQSRVEAAIETHIALNFVVGSERQKLIFLNGVSGRTDRTISFNMQLMSGDPDASGLAALVLLQRKGRVLDTMTGTLVDLRERSDAHSKSLLDQLNETTERLGRLVLNDPKNLPQERQEARNLEEERESLESQIGRRNAEFRARSQTVTLAAVQTAIPNNAALVEFATYRPFDPKAESNREAYGQRRYVVYVVRRQGTPRGKDLGEAKAIDADVAALRQALRDPLRRDVRELARSLDEKVMRPVRALLGDATQLLVSPDGELNLIPFEALVDEQNRYLMQRYTFTYLTSGRDLLRMNVSRGSKSRPMVVANPWFGEPAAEQIASSEMKPAVRVNRHRSVTSARSLSQVYFAPLSATEVEGRTIQFLYPDTTLLTGHHATESSLKALVAPRMLHLATHGFFLEESGNEGLAKPQPSSGENANPRIENPLLRSGLALAGANVLGSGNKDDGILTALEASGLNLWGTKLVVLSACDTGLGEVRNGEGVYGLRRAFVLAGTESLVMSLWPISDYSTRKLMVDYYKNLKLGMGRGEALRRVQLKLLQRNKDLHPFYWANFIQSGEWANLDGKR
jgi:CHAT domain-containing protein